VGLALVRHVAEAHGGRVTVASRPGEGSRFTLWFPLS
jgi:two-component system sensor histidine kinase BaeS